MAKQTEEDLKQIIKEQKAEIKGLQKTNKALNSLIETPTIDEINSLQEYFIKDWVTPEQFLNSKGIDPAIKSSPIQNVTFIQLCELLNEYKNA